MAPSDAPAARSPQRQPASRFSAGPRKSAVLRAFWAGLPALCTVLAGCNYRHAAPVRASDLPPAPGPREVHSSPLVVEVLSQTNDSQCVAYEGYRTLCFHDVRTAVEKSLVQGLWPAFPSVRSGTASDALPGDYVLQVDVRLDVLPPGPAGPGWSTALQGQWRLLRDGAVLAEETLASRSRAEFPYGGALGAGATEVVDAVGTHVASSVGQIAETRPLPSRPLPAVAARRIGPDGAANAEQDLEQKPPAKPPVVDGKVPDRKAQDGKAARKANASADEPAAQRRAIQAKSP